jgi:hypothetical protein
MLTAGGKEVYSPAVPASVGLSMEGGWPYMHLPGELLCVAAALLREVPQVHVITQPRHSPSEFSN